MEKVFLITGYVVWGIFALAFILLFLRVVSRAILRPWYFVKHLIPGFQWTEKEYVKRKDKIDTAKKDPSITYGYILLKMDLKRKGNFAILTSHVKDSWFYPKHYLIYIKKEKLLEEEYYENVKE